VPFGIVGGRGTIFALELGEVGACRTDRLIQRSTNLQKHRVGFTPESILSEESKPPRAAGWTALGKRLRGLCRRPNNGRSSAHAQQTISK
jgi:hypothetical protein